MHIPDDERATLLAALRLYEAAVRDNGEMPPHSVRDLATSSGGVIHLDSAGCRDLFERLDTAKAISLS